MRLLYFLMSVGLSCQSYNDQTKYYGRYPDIQTLTTVPTTVRGNPSYNDRFGRYPDVSTSYMTTVPRVPNIVCDGSWDSPFQFKLSPGKNGRSEYVSQVLGNMFYSLSDGDIAAIQPIAERHFDFQSENGQVMVKNKWNGEKVACGTFKNFILERFYRNKIQNRSRDQNDFWNIGCWMERWTNILPGAQTPNQPGWKPWPSPWVQHALGC